MVRAGAPCSRLHGRSLLSTTIFSFRCVTYMKSVCDPLGTVLVLCVCFFTRPSALAMPPRGTYLQCVPFLCLQVFHAVDAPLFVIHSPLKDTCCLSSEDVTTKAANCMYARVLHSPWVHELYFFCSPPASRSSFYDSILCKPLLSCMWSMQQLRCLEHTQRSNKQCQRHRSPQKVHQPSPEF